MHSDILHNLFCFFISKIQMDIDFKGDSVTPAELLD